MKRIFKLTVGCILLCVIFQACKSKTDTTTFKTIRIGNQEWAAANLALTVDSTGKEFILGKDYFYPNDDSSTVEQYGLLYTWDAAMRVVPKGWHIPTADEWDELFFSVRCDNRYFGSPNIKSVAKALSASTGWKHSDTEGTVGYGLDHNNATRFSALPAGNANPTENFGFSAHYWTSNQMDNNLAYCQVILNASDHVITAFDQKKHALSVRCIRNAQTVQKHKE